MKAYFDHEKLNVYQVSLAFNEWVGEFLATVEAKAAAKDQLDFEFGSEQEQEQE